MAHEKAVYHTTPAALESKILTDERQLSGGRNMTYDFPVCAKGTLKIVKALLNPPIENLPIMFNYIPSPFGIGLPDCEVVFYLGLYQLPHTPLGGVRGKANSNKIRQVYTLNGGMA